MTDYKGKFIGEKKVASVQETEEKTEGGFGIIKVYYKDESIEHLSSLMFSRVIADKACDDTELREKRTQPVIYLILALLRDWGIKVGELQYVVSSVNGLLNDANNAALLALLAQWMPRPNNLDDATYIAMDRILRSLSPDTLKDMIKDKPTT